MPSYKQMQAIHFAKRAGLIMGVLIVGTGLYFLVQSDGWKQLTDRVSELGRGTEGESVVPKVGGGGTSEFEEFLERSNTQQLITRSTELVDAPYENLFIRLERQFKKIQIADKLLESFDDDRAITIGLSTKLAAIRTRELINFDQNLTSPETLNELAEFSEQNLDSKKENVARQAQLGKIHAKVITELLDSETPEFSVDPQTVKQFRSVCSKYQNDKVVATELYGLLERIHVHAPSKDHEKFINAFTSVYANSNNEQLKLMSEDLAQALVESEFELVDIFDSIESLRDEAVEKLNGQILAALKLSYVSHEGYRRIFSGIQDIASFGNYAVAKELSGQLQNKIINKPALMKLADENETFRDQIKLAGRKFVTNGIVSLDGKPYSFQHPDADAKAVFFLSYEDIEESGAFLFEIMNIAGRFVAAKRFCLLVVYMDNGKTPAGLAEIKRVSRLVPLVEFSRIALNEESNKEMLDQLSIVKTPLLLLLNKSNEVVGIDIAKKDFETRFFEIMDSK